MEKKELLKLKEGIYLVTDSICNYNYTLIKTSDNHLIASVRVLQSLNTNSVTLFRKEEYDPEKAMFSVMASVGGLTVHSDGFGIFRDLNIVCPYNENTWRNDLKIFKLNHKINLGKYDRKRL